MKRKLSPFIALAFVVAGFSFGHAPPAEATTKELYNATSAPLKYWKSSSSTGTSTLAGTTRVQTLRYALDGPLWKSVYAQDFDGSDRQQPLCYGGGYHVLPYAMRTRQLVMVFQESGKCRSDTRMASGKYVAVATKRIANPSWVKNLAGDRIKVRFQLDGSYEYLVEKSQASTNADYIARSTNAFRSAHDDRCIYWGGVGAADGYYKLHGNTWVSMPQTDTSVTGYAFNKCPSNARWIDQVR